MTECQDEEKLKRSPAVKIGETTEDRLCVHHVCVRRLGLIVSLTGSVGRGRWSAAAEDVLRGRAQHVPPHANATSYLLVSSNPGSRRGLQYCCVASAVRLA